MALLECIYLLDYFTILDYYFTILVQDDQEKLKFTYRERVGEEDTFLYLLHRTF